MLHHIVMWKLKDFAGGKSKAENALLMKAELENLLPKIQQIQKLEVGIGMEASTYSDFDIVLDMWFETYQDMEIYQQHPVHKKISEWITTIRETKAGIDCEIL